MQSADDLVVSLSDFTGYEGSHIDFMDYMEDMV